MLTIQETIEKEPLIKTKDLKGVRVLCRVSNR